MFKPKFWSFKNSGGAGELFLYGAISDISWFDDDVTPAQFQRDLNALGPLATLDVYINSPGGDAFAGITIYSILKRCTAVITTHVDGLAASAASIVFLAGNVRRCPKNATIMIHEASVCCNGNKHYLEKLVGELSMLDDQLADLYAEVAAKSSAEMLALMEAETWMNGEDAVALGIATECEEPKQFAACADAAKWMPIYKHPPKSLASDIPEQDAAQQAVATVTASATLTASTAAAVSAEPDADIQGALAQPVADISILAEQRKQFNNIKRKILEVEDNG